MAKLNTERSRTPKKLTKQTQHPYSGRSMAYKKCVIRVTLQLIP